MTIDGSEAAVASTATRVRVLNDAFRRSFAGGQVVMTASVNALAPEIVLRVVECIKAFDGFDADDDPYGEHDFGALDVGDARFFWKIDCYDRSLRFHSPDATNPAVTQRVLTIMLADEY